MKTTTSLLCTLGLCLSVAPLSAAEDFVRFSRGSGDGFTLSVPASALSVAIDTTDCKGIRIAADTWLKDYQAVTGQQASIAPKIDAQTRLVVGSLNQSALIKALVKAKRLDAKLLKGKTEKYIITTVADDRVEGGKMLVIAGSDMRGTIYGIYELSRQMGVSPWYWWADVPVQKHDTLYIKEGLYTDGEPTVRYRGLFLNDEAPCLSQWAPMTFPDAKCPSALPTARGFNHHFYTQVFELLLRLKANYLWPAMWSNAFYADDPLNGQTAQNMGIMMGTSHHEPMARNHQEWARHRKEYGAWDYNTNQEVIDKFFREGMERAKNNEDIITIGMRGDGDTGLGGKEGHDDEYVSEDEKNMKLLERVIKNQRQIIKEVTGKPAEQRQQIWAIYKEVQRFYDMGLKVPDDVLILLCDDNWGNIRRVPKAADRNRKGGWGMYYHVDYCGAPRNTKWMNVTPISHMWEQLYLTYTYGIDRMWILNVGDLKPMEYPIDLFMSMAWRPTDFTSQNFEQHARAFCASIWGDAQADEAARILLTYSKYNGRVTPEMLSAKTYNLTSGEWKNVVADYKILERDALYQYLSLPAAQRDAYYQLLLFPVKVMANLYEMYYAQAQNQYLYAAGDPEANTWADRVEQCFVNDSLINAEYNHVLAGGKWNHMMDEVHIGYTSWNGPRHNICPKVQRLSAEQCNRKGGYVYTARNGVVSMEAGRYYQTATAPASEVQWTEIVRMGRTRSAMSLMPYAKSVEGASITYKFRVSASVSQVKVHVVTNSTLAFERTQGHRYTVGLKGQTPVEVNYNGNYNEDNQWVMYDIVATRVIETVTPLSLTDAKETDGMKEYELVIAPLEPGMVLENVVVDCGGYEKSHLFMSESPFVRCAQVKSAE